MMCTHMDGVQCFARLGILKTVIGTLIVRWLLDASPIMSPTYPQQLHYGYITVQKLSNLVHITRPIDISWINHGLIPGMGTRHFSPPEHPEQHWGPPHLLLTAYSGFFPRVWSRLGIKLSTHRHTVMRLRMSGAVPLHPIYAFLQYRRTLSFHIIFLLASARFTAEYVSPDTPHWSTGSLITCRLPFTCELQSCSFTSWWPSLTQGAWILVVWSVLTLNKNWPPGSHCRSITSPKWPPTVTSGSHVPSSFKNTSINQSSLRK